jgi:hypothetical protein
VLRKIKNPRELYIGNLQGKRLGKPITIPGKGREYGYDLIAQDWVAPHGLGTRKDFVFKLNGKTTGKREYDYILTLSFSNDGDGIQEYTAHPIHGSRLRLPHEAPQGGYERKLVQRQASTFERFIAYDFPEDQNYFFRIRTKKDEKGNIESALYGKIYGNIMFSPSKKATIDFLYYLNPDTNDRNLESDYKKNLFPSKLKFGYLEYPP